jgi:cytochrome c oxidase assembly protein subunit 11
MTSSHAPLVKRLLLLVAGAFAFAFALVPLYNVLCEATGFNGKTAGQGTAKSSVIRDGFGIGGLTVGAAVATPAPSQIDRSRTVAVEFTGTVMPGLPWEMRPLTVSLDTHPGEMQQVRYLLRNTSSRPVTAQAIPSVTPGQAAQHFDKIECFCFSQQSLAPGESREMPLTFIVKPDIDKDIRHITLSYAFFSIDGQRETLTAKPEAKQ